MANDTKARGQQERAEDPNAQDERGVPRNEPGNKEPAEGSRDTVTGGGGISNRPRAEEEERQQNVPPRGERKDGSHA